MVDRKEATADIVVNLGTGSTDESEGAQRIPVQELSYDKKIDFDTIYGAGHVIPSGYSINQMSYSGTMTIKGNRKDLEKNFFDENGIPKELESIVITHLDGESTNLNTVLCTNQGYESNSGETTETTFEFIAMSKDNDTNPETQAGTGDQNLQT
jgi:hypothetical protein